MSTNPLSHLRDKKIILGSGSPRRKYLLSEIGVDFDVLAADIDEIYPYALPLDQVASYLANLKFEHIKKKQPETASIIITADSIVVCDNEILGKPDDLEHATKIIRQLSDKPHIVYTGVCIGDDRKTIQFQEKTVVYFDPLTLNEIEYYVNNCQVLDRAGAYGIQDWIGLCKVSKIEGSYFNVMGLPIHRVYDELLHWQVPT